MLRLLLLFASLIQTSVSVAVGQLDSCDINLKHGCNTYEQVDDGNGGLKNNRLNCTESPRGIMPWAIAPIVNPAYEFRSGDSADKSADPTTYDPDSIMDLFTMVKEYNMKYRGIMAYAVDDSGTRVGGWEFSEGEQNFWDPWVDGEACRGVLTHRNGDLKPFHTTLRFRTPPAGTGRITFKVLYKFGEANTGDFYYPAEELVLDEGTDVVPNPVYVADPGTTCTDYCASVGLVCNADGFADMVGESNFRTNVLSQHSCRYPLLSGCREVDGTIEVGSGYCVYQDDQCQDGSLEAVAGCDSAPEGPGQQRFCPCQPGMCSSIDCGARAFRSDPTCADPTACTADECCEPFCSGYACAPRVARASPTCAGASCTEDECCEAFCTGFDCSSRPAAKANPTCLDGSQCTIDECCEAAVPPVTCSSINCGTRPTLATQPAAANCATPNQCTVDDCCEETCPTDYSCSDTALTSYAPGILQTLGCGADGCDDGDCCFQQDVTNPNPTCASHTCGSGFTDGNTPDQVCFSVDACTDQECCLKSCNSESCGDYGTLDATATCQFGSCRPEECCLPLACADYDGCISGVQTVTNETCSLDAGCQRGDCCQSVAVSGCNNPSLAECATNDDCVSGNCENSCCIGDVSCETDDDCLGDNQVCTDSVCVAGPGNPPPPSDSGSHLTVSLFALALALVQGSSLRLSVLLVCALALLPSTLAHNWLWSRSRAPYASYVQPCKPRSGIQPHVQVRPGQEFPIEWAGGHDGIAYFALVKAEDEESLATLVSSVDMEAYLASAPENLMDADDRYKKVRVDNSGQTKYQRELPSGDALYYDRPDVTRGSGDTLYELQPQYTANDMAVEYYSSEYPYIKNAWKFEINPEINHVNTVDSARFWVPFGSEEGDYVMFYKWHGNFDCVDINVINYATPVPFPYGYTNGDGYVPSRIDHCMFDRIEKGAFWPIVVHGPEGDEVCTRWCTSAARTCKGVNLIPWNLWEWDWPFAWNKTDNWILDLIHSSRGSHDPYTTGDWQGARRDVVFPFLFNETGTLPTEDFKVCWGFEPKAIPANSPLDKYMISDDPDDPVFYSTCYDMEENYVFIGYSNTTPPVPVQHDWRHADKCITCEAAAENSLDTVPTWTLEEGRCRNCKALDVPLPNYPTGDLIRSGRNTYRFSDQTGTNCPTGAASWDYCAKREWFRRDTWFGGSGDRASLPLSVCTNWAKTDPECQKDFVVWRDGDYSDKQCYCIRDDPCCHGMETEATGHGTRGAVHSMRDEDRQLPANHPDLNCGRGVLSGNFCCSEGCSACGAGTDYAGDIGCDTNRIPAERLCSEYGPPCHL